MKNILLIFGICMVCLVYPKVNAQNDSQQVNIEYYKAQAYLEQKGEVYFTFNIGSREELFTLTQIISIDNVKNLQVWAYANSKEFEQFSGMGYDYTVLTHPGDLLPDVAMYTGPEKGIWQFDTYPTYPQYLAMMDTFQIHYPDICKVIQIGTSVNGRKLLFAKISDNVNIREAEPRFAYISSMHGNETTGYILMMRLINYLLTNYGTNAEVTNLVNSMEIWINPLANPDGTYAGGDNTVSGATRENANYIDMNRNYPDPRTGLHPDGNAYQPEVVAMMALADSIHFVSAANFHGGAEVCNYPFDTWTSAQKTHADDNWWQHVCREFADTVHIYGSTIMTDLDNGITNGGDWYVITGGRQDYMNYYKYCREFTCEVSSSYLLPANQLPTFWGYYFRSLMNYMKEANYGFRGIVTDSCSGQPIVAKVFINTHDRDSSHVYTEATLGDYYRPVMPGAYSVTYSANGYISKTYNVAVTSNNITIRDVQLNPIPPTANFTNTSSGCTVNFICTTPGITSWLWNFGDSQTSALQNPTHTFSGAGPYNVVLTVTNCAGSNQSTQSIQFSMPAVYFSADATSTCSGEINFTDMSTNAELWSWDFGDGGNSTDQNPTHIYTSNGTFTVTLTATNCAGNNQLVKTDYINVNLATPPVTTDASRCGTGSVTLTASGNGTLNWYNTSTGGTSVGTGSSFSTPSLTTTTTYYVESQVNQPSQYFGNTDTTINGSLLNSTPFGLNFDVYVPLRLVSVIVNAGSAGVRQIFLTDGSGNNLDTVSANLPAGRSRVTLNFDLQPGSYRLMGPSNANLWRNNANLNYPYELPGVISIISSTASTPTSRYYYFYKWEIRLPGCTSPRSPVTATISSGPQGGVSQANTASFCSGGSAILTLSDNTGTSIQWQQSPDGTGSWANVTGGSGATSATYTTPVLTSTTYYRAVISEAGCTDAYSTITEVTINTPPTATITGTNLLCHGDNNGSADVNASGGHSPYTYLWSNGSTIYNPANLSAGVYSVVVTDNTTCTVTASVTITEPPAIDITISTTAATCGQANGSATADATGGTGTITYHWDNGTNAATISNMTSGTYHVTVTDANSCTATSSAVINNLASFNADIISTDLQCYGDSNGTSIINVTGGQTPYTYLWSTGSSANSITGLSAGIINVLITDGNNCSTTLTDTIYQPGAIIITTTVTDATCNLNNGSLTANASGGTGNFSYLWGGGETTQTIANLSSGVYLLVVTDANSCQASTTDTVNNISSATASITSQDISCYGQSTGSAIVAVSGGTPPYSYHWSDGSGNANVSGLPAGPIAVTVTDHNDCTVEVTDTIFQPAQIVIDVTITPETTTGASDGSATANVTGGTPPYTYSWSNGLHTSSINNVSAGTYSLAIIDAHGCFATIPVVVDLLDGVNIASTNFIMKLHPNPTRGLIHIKSSQEIEKIEVVNLIGKSLLLSDRTKKNMMLDISSFDNGVYLIKLYAGTETIIQKIILAK
ncbi:MAG: PKD domain-containing protein [Bacteroidia bacterium]|nr:PKD domain-containing protein [Bacteroidia bacterium]